MQKDINNETGDVSFRFTGEEIKKWKMGAVAAGAVFVLAVGTSLYSLISMNSLKQENALYQNQLHMAQQKLDEMADKTQTIEKLSDQLQDMIKANNNGAAQNISQGGAGGQGGASTVPDKARNVRPGDHQNVEETKADVHTPGQLLSQMRKLDARLDTQIKTLIVLREQVMNQTYGMQVQMMHTSSTTPDMWPVKGEISSGYGFRNSPGGIGSTYHEGIDIASDYGVPVEATASGTVTQASWVDGYGYLVEIKHDGGISTRYGHNSALLVTVGQQVEQGTVVALVGSTGNSTGPHCHYEVRINGDAVDPVYFLPGNY